MGQRLDVW
jgi:hypothetical protein